MSSYSGAGAGLSTDELRAAVRSVLRDVLPVGATTTPTMSTTPSATTPASDGDVAIRTDAELAAFVRRVAVLCEDATRRADLQAGRHRFTLAGGDGMRPSTSPPASGSVLRIDRGAVTERAVKKAAADGTPIVVGRRAVLTPLARDKARSLGVVIEKES